MKVPWRTCVFCGGKIKPGFALWVAGLTAHKSCAERETHRHQEAKPTSGTASSPTAN